LETDRFCRSWFGLCRRRRARLAVGNRSVYLGGDRSVSHARV